MVDPRRGNWEPARGRLQLLNGVEGGLLEIDLQWTREKSGTLETPTFSQPASVTTPRLELGEQKSVWTA
jgi:hypothetical protein